MVGICRSSRACRSDCPCNDQCTSLESGLIEPCEKFEDGVVVLSGGRESSDKVRNLRVTDEQLPATSNLRPATSIAMISNYFKIAWRNLVKNKGYSAINI